MIHPDEKTYLRDAASHSVVPVFEEIRSDFETPLSLFLKARGMFLLESIERGENVGRYSFITRGTKFRITFRGREIAIEETGKAEPVLHTALDNPLEEAGRFLGGLRAPDRAGLPPFSGGAVGYLGYETARYFENIPVVEDRSGVPDGILVIPEMVLVFDSVKRSTFVIAVTFPGDDPAAAYGRALEIIRETGRLLEKPLPAPQARPAGPAPVLQPDISKAAFLEGVETVKRHIRCGDIIQAVVSQRFTAESDLPPFAIYQALRRINPSPYLFYLDFESFQLIGSSPEVMVKVQNGELLTKPIAGTRPRGTSLTEDTRLSRELRADPKERAEHLMLVDLARNDLGRVAAPGTVEVTDFMSVEKYSHVMHLVSTVKAELDSGRDVFDVVRATFPAGTLTGAPKIRAMEIISAVEKRRRGPYGGMVLYLGFNGNLDSCITIRTLLVEGRGVTLQAGAGIVADSRPAAEYEETVDKARALFEAVERAARGD
ncbi:MAG: anthranilate synthase component I family protein [Acidobacteriota bacterium]|nr:anthranilate synthase component I family protein [Acidobacteriota bacterium]